MFDAVRAHTLRFFRVPHDPVAPAGAPGSAHVFRAGKNFYKFRLLRWSARQAAALVGIAVSLTVLSRLEEALEAARVKSLSPAAPGVAPEPGQVPAPRGQTAEVSGTSGVDEGARPAKSPTRSRRATKNEGWRAIDRMVERWPKWIVPVLKLLEWGGIALYLLQIPVTYAMARLDYELRWYIVTDRSLRIRSGLASVQEITMSFANVQQVTVSQGPLQRLLGIADVKVQSAGGGDDSEPGANETLHAGVFHGVDNATQIRDLILERLRRFRQAGLGDPDDPQAQSPDPAPAPEGPLDAARELLQEARALRQTLG